MQGLQAPSLLDVASSRYCPAPQAVYGTHRESVWFPHGRRYVPTAVQAPRVHATHPGSLVVSPVHRAGA